ncbi:hypothetical protein [Andreprevotia lacus]|nr:hypothetical protein [Andreprevotia lacus]
MTKAQRDMVAEVAAITAEIMDNCGERLHQLAAAMELQGVQIVQPAALRAIVVACSMTNAQAHDRLARDECARMRAVKSGSFTRLDEPLRAAA